MSDLSTELAQLTDQRLDYVMARSKVNSDRKAIIESGINRNTFYSWAVDEREKLNELAQRIKREAATRALMVIQDAAEEAARVKVSGLKSRNEHIKQDVATEILDRMVGKPTNKTEVTGKDGEPQKLIVEYVNNPYPVTGVSSSASDDTPEVE